MRILLVDFYDSFTFNLLHYLEYQEIEVDIIRNDKIKSLIFLDDYSHVVLSPGPGLPSEKENLQEIVAYCSERIPVLGICLGMQAIGQFLGGELVNMGEVKHGVSERIFVDNSKRIFNNLPSSFDVGLYHSWCIVHLDDEFVDARLENGKVMAISCDSKKMYGVQFHPESILSSHGKELLINFIKLS
ncbi:MAG: aminodeoxychorismate/anthranilate synthase component II [Crocinitomicaceae bacterium]|tara:strand:- start:6236 stop:6796 length:561 start_codon:yes stop_codon:yes gene_type:complete